MMKNPCLKCREEGLENIKPLTLVNIADKYIHIKLKDGNDVILCPYHFDLTPLNILEISEINGNRIVFKNLKVDNQSF